MTRGVPVLLAVAATACSDRPVLEQIPTRWLRPSTQIAPEHTERLGAFSRIDVLGCTIVAADWMERRLWVLESGLERVTPLGRPGDGPGEFKHVRALAVASDSLLTALDWGRRRLVQYRWDGTLVTDVALSGGVQNHAAVGPFRPLPDGRFVDYWLADFVSGWAVSAEALDTLPLVGILSSDGVMSSEGWGRPERPKADDAVNLRFLLQSGDVAVVGDSLFVLRHVTGSVEVYSLAMPSPRPARRMDLRRFREWVEPREQGSEIRGTPWGQAAQGGIIEIENSTLAFDVDSEGRLYVVSRMPSEYDSPQVSWAAELLAIYSRTGEELAFFRLPTWNTRQVRLAGDGSIVLLSHPDAHPKSGFHILILPPVMATRNDRPCNWIGTSADSQSLGFLPATGHR